MYQERINQLIDRIQGYPLREVIVELVILWIVVYVVVRFLRDIHGARVAKGIALILIVVTPAIRILAPETEYERLNFLYNRFAAFAALTLIIVFQPELRRALVRLGKTRIFRSGTLRAAEVIDELVGAVAYLSRNKVGALIAIERQVGIDAMVVGGTPLDAQVSRDLLKSIFWPGGALHDMAVVIREDRVAAAGVQLPLAQSENFSSELGSRHRAAIGLTQETDALVLIVSEETGTISIAERGKLTRGYTPDSLRQALVQALGQQKQPVRVAVSGSAGPAPVEESDSQKPAMAAVGAKKKSDKAKKEATQAA